MWLEAVVRALRWGIGAAVRATAGASDRAFAVRGRRFRPPSLYSASESSESESGGTGSDGSEETAGGGGGGGAGAACGVYSSAEKDKSETKTCL
jgi:hypothetical protein